MSERISKIVNWAYDILNEFVNESDTDNFFGPISRPRVGFVIPILFPILIFVILVKAIIDKKLSDIFSLEFISALVVSMFIIYVGYSIFTVESTPINETKLWMEKYRNEIKFCNDVYGQNFIEKYRVGDCTVIKCEQNVTVLCSQDIAGDALTGSFAGTMIGNMIFGR